MNRNTHAGKKGPLWVAVASLFGMSSFGCGGNTPVSPPNRPIATTPVATSPVDAPEPTPVTAPLIEARGHGTDSEQAYAAALVSLEKTLYDSDAWAEVLEVPVFDAERDSIKRDQGSSDAQVVLGLSAERVAEVLAAVEQSPWQPSVPGPLADTVERAARLQFAGFLCQRRRDLLDIPPPNPCTSPDVDAIPGELQKLAEAVRVRLHYVDGVPLASDGRPLRPLVVIAEHRLSGHGGSAAWQPLRGLPFLASPDQASAVLQAETLISDDTGVVRFEVQADAAWPDGLTVAVNRRQLLGPLASLWPETALSAPGRQVRGGALGLDRWSLVTTERVGGKIANKPVFAGKLADILTARGAEKRLTIPADLARKLASASPEALAGNLPELADAWQGQVDVLIVADIDSDYASRAGTHRRWYEASGRVKTFDVWTGKELSTYEDTVTASGIGESRADRAARIRLADALAARLLAARP
ncbi:MAG: hypothetical protein MJE77_03415 [Proteobacteria bacterium]|nr:hypothetical protein [Pseudomonadota bacterium]